MLWSITVNGLPMGSYPGTSREQALDAYARDAGYRDYADLLARVPDAPDDVVLVEEAV